MRHEPWDARVATPWRVPRGTAPVSRCGKSTHERFAMSFAEKRVIWIIICKKKVWGQGSQGARVRGPGRRAHDSRVHTIDLTQSDHPTILYFTGEIYNHLRPALNLFTFTRNVATGPCLRTRLVSTCATYPGQSSCGLHRSSSEHYDQLSSACCPFCSTISCSETCTQSVHWRQALQHDLQGGRLQ